MSILVRLIQMYFDSFALTVAHYTWALAFTVTAVAVPQQQFIRQSFTFHLLDCNKTSLILYALVAIASKHTRLLLSLYIKRQFYRFNEETMSIRHISTRPFRSSNKFMWFCPFVFVCSFAVCTNNQTIGFNCCTCYQIHWHYTPISTAAAAVATVKSSWKKRQ